MKLRLQTLLAFAFFLPSCFAGPLDLGSLQFSSGYKVDAYIRAAADLQAMGRDAACHVLNEFSRTNQTTFFDMRVITICRMLFTPRGTNEFRRAEVGNFMGPGWSTDWPLFPVEIVDGIPFKVLSSGVVRNGSGPESGASYLSYCITNCDWNTFKFLLPTIEEKKAALQKLLSSKKWKRPLLDYEKDFLSKQIE